MVFDIASYRVFFQRVLCRVVFNMAPYRVVFERVLCRVVVNMASYRVVFDRVNPNPVVLQVLNLESDGIVGLPLGHQLHSSLREYIILI